MIPTLIVAVTLAVVYWFPIRRWMGRWGTTPSDLTRVMAGDGLIAHPTYSGTMAVIVNARPEHIWPWLVQMGYQRGGSTATTGSIASLAIWIARAPPAFFPSFSTWPSVMQFPWGGAQAGRWRPSSRITRSCWI
jgi:hypothetical protein